MVALHTSIAIVAIILLIIRFKVDPIVALILGCFYLGLASGVGFEDTVGAITSGFGEIMAKIGLLIGFGVLMGALLYKMGAFTTMVEALVRVVPPNRLPYALAIALSTIAPSIYVDVQVVLAAPVARSSAKFLGKNGLAWLAGALGIGIFAGYVFVVPGLAAISIAGLLHIQLGTYLLFGIVIGPLTAVLTVWIFRRMLNHGWWNAEKDEQESDALDEEEASGAVVPADQRPNLLMSLAPILVPLLMIAFGAFAELLGFNNSLIDFIGNANVALFLGLLMAYVMARKFVGADKTGEAFTDGLHTTGEILLVTGVGGSLGCSHRADRPGRPAGRAVHGWRRRPCRGEHPARLVHRRPAAPGNRLRFSGGDHRRRDSGPHRGLVAGGPRGDRSGGGLRRDVRPPGQQQLLLDVQRAARTHHSRRPQDHDHRDIDRVVDLAATGDGGSTHPAVTL